MQAMTVRRLSESHSKARLYIDGKRVSKLKWDGAHLGRSTDAYASRTETRKDGSAIVREFHCIRVKRI
jgi:hypothetical protein